MIIGSTIFNYLTKLDIKFHKEHIRDEEYTSFYIKPIAENIANLPALKVLKVSYIKIDLDDMETLHNGALELEKISFGSIELVDTSSILNVARGNNLLLKAGGEPFVHKTASKLEGLSITLVADKTLDNSDRISNNLAKWIVYAGQKYPSIERLLIAPNNSTYNLYVGDRSLGDPLTKATSHMPNLKIYQMGFSNVIPNILRALDDNGVELDTIELSVTSEKDLINQIGSFKCSHQKQHVSTISILCVESYFTDDAFRLSSSSLDNHYTKLVNLEIEATASSYTVLVDILENAPATLESVDFNSVTFYIPQRKT